MDYSVQDVQKCLEDINSCNDGHSEGAGQRHHDLYDHTCIMIYTPKNIAEFGSQ